MVSTAVALVVTVTTLVAVTALGVLYARGRVRTVRDFVSAPNTTNTPALAASLLATNLGTWILFSPAEAGAARGGLTAVLGYALGSAVPLALFVSVGPRIRSLVPSGHSVTEFVLARYGRLMYAVVLAVVVFYMSVFLAVELTGAAAALSLVAGIPPWQTAALLGLFVLTYTAYGGLVASIFTDTLQTLVMLPLMALGFGAALLALGGTDAIYARTLAHDPALLSLSNGRGLRFGIYVAVAITSANALNQGFWQRVYAARDEATVRRAFAVAAVGSVPVVFLAGLFGLDAAGLGLVSHRSGNLAFFRVVATALPEWVVLVVVVVTALLVTSTADALLNGLASLAATELEYVLPAERRLLGERSVTAVIALVATAIASLQFSELALFLTADLLTTAAIVPVVLGLYTPRLSERGALLSFTAGTAVGLVFDPVLRRALVEAGSSMPFLPPPSFTASFVGTLAVSSLVAVAGTGLGREGTRLEDLDRVVRTLVERREGQGP